jgi:hypothetical protein
VPQGLAHDLLDLGRRFVALRVGKDALEGHHEMAELVDIPLRQIGISVKGLKHRLHQGF